MLSLPAQYDDLPWLNSEHGRLKGLLRSDQCPHALLIHGQPGVGRRQLAIWLAEALLETPLAIAGKDDEPVQAHPDLILIEPLPDKKDIAVEQIRDLIEFTELTSHQGAGRCAIIYPAERMNKAGLNSLLKTLEEPAAGVVLVLISESLSRLPATVVSRCQRLRVPTPSEAEALDWLSQQSGEPGLEQLLGLAGGGPLAALELVNAGLAEEAGSYTSDLAALAARRADPVAVAANWAKNPDLALKWLYWHVAGQIRGHSREHASDPADFVKLDQIRELRRFIHGGVSAELGLTGLLVHWYGADDTV